MAKKKRPYVDFTFPEPHSPAPGASNKKLKRRIAKLHARGIEPGLPVQANGQRPTVRELLDEVGDLTLCDIKALVDLSVWMNNEGIQAMVRNESFNPNMGLFNPNDER